MTIAYRCGKDPLIVVMPVYNEQDSIRQVVQEWVNSLNRLGESYRLLILNDGSTDNTKEELNRIAEEFPSIEVIHKSNSGHGQTCIQGYREAIARGAGWVFQIDSDGQCDPKYFAAVWQLRTVHPVVFGRRVSRDDGAAREFISLFCRFGVLIATGVGAVDPNVPYRLIRADVLNSVIHDFPDDFKLANILLAVILQKGLGRQVGYVNIGFRRRTGGEPSVKLMKFVLEGWRLITHLMAMKAYIQRKTSEINLKGRTATESEGLLQGRPDATS
jgi:dolichol-phosphate mannosyltransferase